MLTLSLQNMKTSAVKIIGKEAEKMNEVWGLDDEGEIKTMWRGSGHRKLSTHFNIFAPDLIVIHSWNLYHGWELGVVSIL